MDKFMDCEYVQSTSNMSYEDWTKLRKSGIGGSDCAAIIDACPYDSAVRVYMDKVGQDVPKMDNEAMRQGRDFEYYVAQRFMEETGLEVEEHNYFLRNKKFPYMVGNIDRKIKGQNVGLECKTTQPRNAKEWEDEKVPVWYELQCHHYMAVTGAEGWWIACLIFGKAFVYKYIKRDENIIQDLIKVEGRFWNDYVLANIMPPPDGSEQVDDILKGMYPESEESSILLTDKESKEVYDSMLEFKIIYKDMEKKYKACQQFFKQKMGNAEMCFVEGIEDVPMSWKTFNRENFDKKAFREENPDLYQKYVTSSSYRVFRDE